MNVKSVLLQKKWFKPSLLIPFSRKLRVNDDDGLFSCHLLKDKTIYASRLVYLY